MYIIIFIYNIYFNSFNSWEQYVENKIEKELKNVYIYTNKAEELVKINNLSKTNILLVNQKYFINYKIFMYVFIYLKFVIA